MARDISITVEATEPVLRFRFATASGSEPRLTCIIIRNAADELPLWWLMPSTFEHVPDARIEILEPSEAEIEELAATVEMDPIEDLPPDDPRHQAALRARDDLEERTQVPLRTLSYGTVPPGFRQAMPSTGPPPTLVRGATYMIHVFGAGLLSDGVLEFEQL